MTVRMLTDHFAAAAAMRRQPQTWVLVCRPKDRSAALSQVQRIKKGVHKAYRSGTYEAKHDRDIHGRPQVWGMWIGEAR